MQKAQLFDRTVPLYYFMMMTSDQANVFSAP